MLFQCAAARRASRGGGRDAVRRACARPPRAAARFAMRRKQRRSANRPCCKVKFCAMSMGCAAARMLKHSCVHAKVREMLFLALIADCSNAARTVVISHSATRDNTRKPSIGVGLVFHRNLPQTLKPTRPDMQALGCRRFIQEMLWARFLPTTVGAG